jgi:transcriptional regulator with XRE-family HTH domain
VRWVVQKRRTNGVDVRLPQTLADAMRVLMQEQSQSYRGLSNRTREVDPEGRGLSHGYLAGLARGEEQRPSRKTMDLLADALHTSPSRFAEWQLASARSLLDETQVGMTQALQNLAKVRGVLDKAPTDETGLVQGSHTPLLQGRGRRRSRYSQTRFWW